MPWTIIPASYRHVRQSSEVKKRAKQLLSEGRTQQEVADILGVNQKTISNWKRATEK
jgi:DNA-binding CsgD family transcriptional regulator